MVRAIFVSSLASKRGEVTGTFDRIYSVGMFVTWFLRGVGLKPCWMCRISNCFVGKQILLGHCFLLESPGKPFLFWLANLIHAHAGPNGVQRTIWEQFLPHLQAEGWCVCFLCFVFCAWFGTSNQPNQPRLQMLQLRSTWGATPIAPSSTSATSCWRSPRSRPSETSVSFVAVLRWECGFVSKNEGITPKVVHNKICYWLLMYRYRNINS